MALEWKRINGDEPPEIGQTVFLCEKYPSPLHGAEAELAIGVHRQDPDNGATYWDVENDQQYAIFEKWTHWAPVNLP